MEHTERGGIRLSVGNEQGEKFVKKGEKVVAEVREGSVWIEGATEEEERPE